MIEVVSSLEEASAKINSLKEPGTTIFAPTLEKGIGFTALIDPKRDRIHLGLRELWEYHAGNTKQLVAKGTLYLDPRPEDKGYSPGDFARDLLLSGTLANCALDALPTQYQILPNLFGGEQVAWQVWVYISGPGMAEPYLRQNTFFIANHQPDSHSSFKPAA